jgi:NTP pyrophosphatase (non-canonical NTP hydrolase)
MDVKLSKKIKLMEITYNNYEELASTTCKNLENEDANILHMKMGILTEAAEVVDILKKKHAYGKEIDTSHLKEELGDILWYTANYCKFVEMDFANVIDNIGYQPLYDRSADFSLYELMELIIINSTALDVNSIYDVIDLTLYAIEQIDSSLNEILDTNIKKLAARYPEGFSSYYALNRNLEAEKKITHG